MPVEDRAKIFMPFNPLSGLQEALREREARVERAYYAGDGVSERLYLGSVDEGSMADPEG